MPNLSFAGEYSREQRIFLKAEALIKKGRYHQAEKLSRKLANYPLQPYLHFEQLKRQMRVQKRDRGVSAFIRTHSNSPIAQQLKSHWLHYLARKRHWRTFLQQYDASIQDKQLNCYAAQAALVHQKRAHAFKKIKTLWLSAQSQPSSCVPVFKRWRQLGGLSKSLIWQRIALAAEQRNFRLVKRLKKYLPKAERKWVSLWRRVDKRPQLVEAKLSSKQKHPFMGRILTHGIKRLAEQDLERVKKMWPRIRSAKQFNHQQRGDIIKKLALLTAIRNNPNAGYWLSMVPNSHSDHTIKEWRVRHALLHQDWPGVLNSIAALPKADKISAQWLYWRARALSALSRKTRAIAIFQTLARNTDYYGMLSAHQITLPYKISRIPLRTSTQHRRVIARHPGIKRARALLALKRYAQARREWSLAIRGFSYQNKKAAVQLATEWSWYDRAIVTAKTLNLDGVLLEAFPLANRQIMLKEAKKRHIDPAWAFAVARQESLFISDARSHVGAVGIMQLMPKTAHRIAKSLCFRYRNKKDLIKAGTNITLGTAYLKKMYHHYQGNPVLATAAYNAGPQRVDEWLPKRNYLPADIWIDTIPFFETRHYLKKVLHYAVIYDYHLGHKPKTQYRMKTIAIDNIADHT